MNKIRSYDDFLTAFESLDKEEHMFSLSPDSAAVRLTEFRKADSAKYDEYRKRMHTSGSKMTVDEFVQRYREEQRQGLRS